MDCHTSDPMVDLCFSRESKAERRADLQYHTRTFHSTGHAGFQSVFLPGLSGAKAVLFQHLSLIAGLFVFLP